MIFVKSRIVCIEPITTVWRYTVISMVDGGHRWVDEPRASDLLPGPKLMIAWHKFRPEDLR